MIKKHLIVLILKILETCSDEKNPLTQIQITNMISDKYPCDKIKPRVMLRLSVLHNSLIEAELRRKNK